MITMNQAATAQGSDAASNSLVNHKGCTFLWALKKTSPPIWELPQPKPQDRVTDLQNKERVHSSRAAQGKRRSPRMDAS
jgi:hypothetical protein